MLHQSRMSVDRVLALPSSALISTGQRWHSRIQEFRGRARDPTRGPCDSQTTFRVRDFLSFRL